MGQFPGIITCHSNSAGIFALAWEKAMTSSNITSGFKSCGIYPFNPQAIPSDAYFPNYLYIAEDVLVNTTESNYSLEFRSSIVQEVNFSDVDAFKDAGKVANYLEQLQNGTEEDNATHSSLQSNTSILEAETVVRNNQLAYFVNLVEEKNVVLPILLSKKKKEILEALNFNSTTVSDFPFANSSYPGDGGNDVLAYPKAIARKKIANRKGQLKYFVLTSQEAYSAKLKYYQDKIQQEREKCERKQL
ncbi:uncharacterized protein LOC124814625 [Hydra vulgaris]|uniref:uncharacterized protein LOC124814625 n=1 Tax=Hydra vulgaris TaxID=6087 RepID=UPI001F5EEF03|nr:uncharacterized protein LOC124814625 [Hydra vulgaris]